MLEAISNRGILKLDGEDRKPLKPLQKVEVHIIYYFKDYKRRDLDNILMKFLLDPLVKLGIIKDDDFKCIKKIIIAGDVDKANPRTEINIISLDE